MQLNHRHKNSNGLRNFVPDNKSIKNEWSFKHLAQIQKNLQLWEDNKYNGWKNADLMKKDRMHHERRFEVISEREYEDIKKVFLAGKAVLTCSSNIELYGVILDIDSYWMKVQNQEEFRIK